MEALFALMTILIPVITGMTALIKKYVNPKFHPVIPVFIGLAVAPLALPLPFINSTLVEIVWAGLLAGLSAGGFYSVGNINRKEEIKKP